jgi:hypothetical protein
MAALGLAALVTVGWLLVPDSNAPSTAEASGTVVEPPAKVQRPTAGADAPATQARPKGDVASASRGQTFRALEEQFAAFQAIDYGESLSGDEGDQDAQLIRLLSDKSAGLESLEQAYTALMTDADDAWSTNASVRIGEARLELADWLAHMPHPSYITESQAIVYQQGLASKADRQAQSAGQVFEEVLTDMPPEDPRRPHVESLLATLPTYGEH